MPWTEGYKRWRRQQYLKQLKRVLAEIGHACVVAILALCTGAAAAALAEHLGCPYGDATFSATVVAVFLYDGLLGAKHYRRLVWSMRENME